MRIVFEHWKYIVRNLWFVLPFALMPAIFLSLTVDFTAIRAVAGGFFRGELGFGFISLLFAFSLIRFDSVLGAIYSACAFVCLVVFTALLLAFVEKHMRIGKRTLSGVFSQLKSHLLAAFGVTLFYTLFYELWAVVLSAVLYAVSAIPQTAFACLLFVFVLLLFITVLLYLAAAFYLWLPCMQITGFRAYNALLYSYRLLVGVRWRLILSMLISYAALFLVLLAGAFIPEWLAVIIAFVAFIFVYISFCVRMETVYFQTDKLDREDILRSYREL